jgi:C1A family cysteine protease
MMKIIAAFAMAAIAMAAPLPEATSTDFAAWKAAHGKSYTGEEHTMRAQIFATNLAFIQDENTKGHGYELGVGPFTDLTNEEFAATMTTKFERTTPRNEVYLPTPMKLHGDSTADSVDWRTSGAVTPVKNQGKCGSCWSFSTTGSIEGANQIAGNTLISLSEQQLVDCAGKYGNKGCQGGSMDTAMTYVKTNGGLDTEEDYQYQGVNQQCDKSKEGKHAATVSGHKDVPQNNPTQLAAAVAKGPVSIAIEADKPAFQHYKTGVLDSTACGTKLDHGVLIVGYGSDSASGEDYWCVSSVFVQRATPPAASSSPHARWRCF